MKQLLFLLLCSIVLSTGYCYTADDFIKNKTTVYADFGHGYMDIELCNPLISNLNVNSSWLSAYGLNVAGKFKTASFNETIFSLGSSACKTVRLSVTYDMKYVNDSASVSIDVVPQIKVAGITYNQSKLAWYNSSWFYMVTVSNLTANYSYMNLTYNAKYNTSFFDLRFTKTDNTTLLNHTFELFNASSWAVVRVNNIDSAVNLWYGNPNATSISNANNTYLQPISYWYLDENDSTKFVRDQNNINNGTCSPANTSLMAIAGMISRGFFFNTTASDYVNLGNNASLNITNAITISAWAKIGTHTSPDTQQVMVAKANNVGGQYQYLLAMGQTISGGYLEFQFKTNSQQAVTPLQYNDNVWHFFVATSNGTNTTIWVDGALKNWSGVASLTQTINADTKIGTKSSGYGYLNGSVDEVGIWNRVLTQAEIQMLYNSSMPSYVLSGESINNQPPSITSANLTPVYPFSTGETLTANITCSDAENSTLDGFVNWYKNGVYNATNGGYAVTNNTNRIIDTYDPPFVAGDNWTGVFWCNDGTYNSTQLNVTRTIYQYFLVNADSPTWNNPPGNPYVYNTNSVWINLSTNYPVSACWYWTNVSGVNTTVTQLNSTSYANLTTFANGDYMFNAWCNNSVGRELSIDTNYTFSVLYTPPSNDTTTGGSEVSYLMVDIGELPSWFAWIVSLIVACILIYIVRD